jgi:solute carrier family 35 protein F5
VGDVVFKDFVPGLQYAVGATFVVAGFFVVNLATLSDVDESTVVHQRDIIDDLEEDGFDECNTETNQRRMARVLSISEPSSNNRRASNVSVLTAHP